MNNVNQEIVMETTHGRKSKCKTEFKAVVNKVLVSGVVLATIIGGSGANAYASNEPADINVEDIVTATQSYGVSMQETVASIRNTIKAIQDMKANGSVSDEMIAKLASEVYALQDAYSKGAEGITLDEVEGILNEAETAIDGLENREEAETAIVVAKAMLGIKVKIDKDTKIGSKEENYTVKQAKAAPMATYFGDVQEGQWFYSVIMQATQKGLFAGTGEVDGVPMFSPEGRMTRAQFITVVGRILELNTTSTGDVWYEMAYNSAIDAGLINKGEIDYNSLEGEITRQEMAMIAVRAMENRNETFGTLYANNVQKAIPDMAKVGSYYKDYVIRAYSEGVLTGDETGAFNPQKTLSRAEGASVLLRLVDASQRVKKDFSQSSSVGQGQDLSAPITIYEGQPRTAENNRFSKVGDIVVKADGTKVVLEMVDGILGKNQGVAPDLYVTTEKGGNTTVVMSNANYGKVFSGYTDFVDSTGTTVVNQGYYVNQITGEGHWGKEWDALESRPSEVGTFNYQLSEEHNWCWFAEFGAWVQVPIQNIGPERVVEILQANGLN